MGSCHSRLRATVAARRVGFPAERGFEDKNGHAANLELQERTVSRNSLRAPPCPNKEEIHLIRLSWFHLQSHVSKVGAVLFTKLFETHPDVKDAFLPFMDLDKDFNNSEELRAHGLRVMRIVEKCLGRMHEPERVEKLLHDLGKKHIDYRAKEDYIDLMGPQFIAAIKPAIDNHWTPAVEEAWVALFEYIAFLMKEGMRMRQAGPAP